MSCDIGYRLGSDLALLWLWHMPAATAQIRPLPWEPSYTAGVALEKPKKKKIYIYIYMYIKRSESSVVLSGRNREKYIYCILAETEVKSL